MYEFLLTQRNEIFMAILSCKRGHRRTLQFFKNIVAQRKTATFWQLLLFIVHTVVLNFTVIGEISVHQGEG